MQGQLIQNFSTIRNKNLLPFGATFQDLVSINKASGSAGSSVAYSDVMPFDGTKSIISYNDTTNTDLVFDLVDSLKTTTKWAGQHFFQIWIRQSQNILQYRRLKLDVEFSVNGIASGQKLEITLPATGDNPDDENLLKDHWYCFWGFFDFPADSEINMSFRHKGVTTIEGNSTLWIGGLKLEANNKALYVPTYYLPPSNVIKKTQNINFGSVAANTITSQTFSFPYALLSNFLEVIPNNSVRSPGVTFEAWISSPGIGTLQVTNGTSGTIVYPPIDYSFILTK